jgi:DNA polymerase (family 10)
MSVNLQLAALFSEIADLLELNEANPFKIRAFRRATGIMEGLEEEITARAEAGTLTDIEGIGTDLAAKISEFLSSGVIGELEELRSTTPEVLVAMTKIPGLGPKNALRLHGELGLESLDDLEGACRRDEVAALKGFGAKSQQNILDGIDFIRRVSGRRPLGAALPRAAEVAAALDSLAEVERISPAGSIRRMKETVGDIDLVAASRSPERVMEDFTTGPWAAQVLAHGPTKSSVRTSDDLQIDLRVVEPEVYGATLMHFTGSAQHNVRLREMAVRRDIKINEYGIFDIAGLDSEARDDPRAGRRLSAATEAECFEALGLPFIPPELREDSGEIAAALAGELPRLIEPGEIRGELHAHTDASDGHHTLEELITHCRDRGYNYIAVTDHSGSLAIANGLDAERMRWQIDRVREANERHDDIEVLVGTEVDIMRDGTLDYPDDILAELDVVIASVHTSFRLGAEEQTARICRAMESEYVFAIGHLTGRMLGERDAYPLDVDAVIETAARTGTALEINASPRRLDLGDRHARQARKAGVDIIICTDAHRPAHLDFMEYGVRVARRAWLEADDVLNTRPLEELRTALVRKRS